MSDNKYNLVNWQESMDVSYLHLEQTENYFTERLSDNLATRLTSFNYGLLPSSDRRKGSSEFEISEIITGKVEIKLRSCNAITAGGYRIAYNPVHTEYLSHTHSFEEEKGQVGSETKYWDVILSINPFERIPTGMPDEKETPPRHPDVREQYQLSITPQGHTNYEQLGKYHLIIGRIRKYGNRYEVDTNYIPACTGMCSHPDLLKYYENFGTLLNDIERASNLILAKIRNRSQNSPLAYHIASMCENMMRYISTIFFRYRNTGRDALPVDIADYFSTLAHTCFISLNFINKIEREELLKYFYEWSDITPGSFEELLSNTLSVRYDHNNIRMVMLQIESFLHVVSELWLRLSTLEYIGQHKENIVISERSYQQETKKKESGGWTILD
ncbi:hypothetical protein M2451_002931 [Dysgonomonas sp. PFB1-18]|uniref:hypothetical protein n=1 Tax=unclassified Dysgonomonas TaxID=2630389 RepID=UPI0013D08AC7|nr:MULTISPECIES: hypothetical protein [unclassified Dysgonomonas]MDH6310041.1 hypothetical protein [Dysgonomonas sp. PF1-14]MDH6339950.1 hypothetical protein [Dysgonomonas sp. PF1-16]MDH6381598.1 hypothetical protein [Dysgonomonas sp. PFB1-18]MDH6398765.1 hypothetical protein [Dysgonomonas sp. PF1-23]NDV93610.1 hypothetical protein [Dysgonomonas sp. 521]